MAPKLGIKDVKIVELPWTKPESCRDWPPLEAELYEDRIRQLRRLMEAHGFSHVIVYGDREHFANIRFLTGYDPRFEESLVIVGRSGKPRLLVGLEGQFYAGIAKGVEVELYREFSLQGQPRKGRDFRTILNDCQLGTNSQVGIVGTKYRETTDFADSKLDSDIPYYIVEALIRHCGKANIQDLTPWFTDSAKGLRIPLAAVEIARAELANQMVYSGMMEAIKALEVGVSEIEISSKLAYDGSLPLSCHIVVSFGANVSLALQSPTPNRLKMADQLSVALGVWGANIARTGIAIRGLTDLPAEISDCLGKVYIPYFDLLRRWYRTLRVGVTGGEVYDSVRQFMEDPFFKVSLNAGHLISDEEWLNAPFSAGSQAELVSGVMIQCDIIVPATPPYPGAHTEDGLVLADKALRDDLSSNYPKVWARIQRRRARMISLGYELHEDVLPLCEMQGQVTPFMLSPKQVLSLA